MKKVNLIAALALSATFICTGCNKEEEEESTISPYIEGLSIVNYPIIDGSTSTLPLNAVIACELMGLDFQWHENNIGHGASAWSIEPQIGKKLRRKFDNVVKSSQTHNSFINLIDQKADIVLSARTMSPDEKKYTEDKGVNLIETPIALDAFIFIVNPDNPIKELATEDIQNIYTGTVTDWEEFGWLPSTYPDWLPTWYPTGISPYIRNPNSGSQELMDFLVMKELDYYKQLPIYEERLVFTMQGLLDAIAGNLFAIGYTVYYYNEHIIRPGNALKTIGIDGVQPNSQTIRNRSYPYTTEVYAVIRSDLDKSSMAYQIYEWLQTDTGRQAISKSGYILN